MATISENDLEQKRQHNEKLRQQIADAEAKAAAQVVQVSNELAAAELDAETARLERQLEAARQTAKVSVAREGSASNLDTVKEDLKAAQAGGTPIGVAVDTNPDDSGSNEKE